MESKIHKKNYLKLSLGFVACLLIRLIPFRAPNIEPILAISMPFSKAYGSAAGFFFPFLSITTYDLLTGKFGIWTHITAITYGFLGFWAVSYFKKRESNPMNYAKFAFMSTLLFDAITGLSIGPLFFGQSFVVALLGQIPFTALHILGNVTFAILLSPPVYRWVIGSKKPSAESIIIFNPRPKKSGRTFRF